MSSPDTEVDGSVCYRHPDRASWTLCQRCGRTICPECQILTPDGVRCPDCVRETGGSVRWQPTAGARPARAKKAGMTAGRQRPAVVSRVVSSTRPVATFAIVALAAILWLTGFTTGNVPYLTLSARPDVAVQVWRYVTSSFAYPSFGGPFVVSTVLSFVIFVYIGWNVERRFGHSRFLGLFFVTGTGAAAIAMLAGWPADGLAGPIWGLAGAYLISVWGEPAARNRLLISLAIWFVLNLFLSGNIMAMIGGALSGIGAMLLLRRYDDRTRSRWWTPYLILAGAIAVLILLAILRSTIVIAAA